MPSVVEYSESALRGKLTSAQGEFVSPWLAERDDVCLFAGAAAKLDNNKERLLVVTRYRLGVFGKSLGGRWKFRELRLLELRGLEVAGGGERATWTFADGETVELKCRTLQEAARATLHAYGLLTLCLDNLPPLYQQEKMRAAFYPHAGGHVAHHTWGAPRGGSDDTVSSQSQRERSRGEVARRGGRCRSETK